MIAVLEASPIQLLGDGPDPHRTGPISNESQPVNEPNDLGLFFDNEKLPAFFPTITVRRPRFIAEGYRATVPKASFGICAVCFCGSPLTRPEHISR